jgi:hypothetical protein
MRLRRPKQVKEGFMDEDGNIIPKFDISENSFKLKEYRDKLDTLEMESKNEIYQHYMDLLKNKDKSEEFLLMNKSMQNALKVNDIIEEENSDSDEAIFSTMSGMNSMEILKDDSQAHFDKLNEQEKTEKLGYLSGENEFLKHLTELKIKKSIKKKSEEKDDDEDKEILSSESFVSEDIDDGSAPLILSEKKKKEKEKSHEVNHEVYDETLKPHEHPAHSETALQKIIEKENMSPKNNRSKERIKIPKIKKIKDKEIQDTLDDEFKSEKNELDNGLDHSEEEVSHLFGSSKANSERTDKTKDDHHNDNSIKGIDNDMHDQIEKLGSEKDQEEIDENIQTDESINSEEKSKNEESNPFVDEKSSEAVESEKSETEENDGDLSKEIHDDDDKELNDNLHNNMDSIDDRYKQFQKEAQMNKDIEDFKNKEDEKEISGQINTDEITNPIQGQPPEAMFEDNKDETKKKKKDEDEMEEESESEEVKKEKPKKDENTLFTGITLEYVVPEMKPLVIHNYHEGQEAKKIENYTETEIVEQISQSTRKLTEEKNKNKHHELGRIYRLYKLLPFCIQRAIESCQPKMEKVVEVCKKFHKKDCLEHNYVVRLECMPSESYFNGACYKNCPIDMTDAKIACVKKKVQKRRVENLEEPSTKKNYDKKYAESFIVTKCKDFGPSFVSLGPDFCIQECPYGWKDLGKLCVKPFRFRNQKVFFFDSSM